MQVLKYSERAIGLAEHAGNVRIGQGSPALDVDQTIPGRQRSSVEAILCYQIMSVQYVKLQEAGLLSSFIGKNMFERDVNLSLVAMWIIVNFLCRCRNACCCLCCWNGIDWNWFQH